METIERLGLGARAIARRRAEIALIEGLALEKLQALDKLLEIDLAIGQTRFHWLRSAPEAPTASNLIGLTERITFQRTLEIDPGLQTRVVSGRWDQMVREGNATPAWLANDFNTSRRHALIVAQVIKLGEKLTDDAVMMFIKLIGRLFSQAHGREKRRHMDHRTDTSKALRLFLDTISALQSANDHGQDALEVLDQKVGWRRLLRIKPELAAMVEESEASPLVLAAEQYSGVLKYATAFLTVFTFRSARRHDSLLTAVAMLRRLHSEGRRALPECVPTSHLSLSDRKLIFGHQKPDRRLYEIATLAALRERLRSADRPQAVHCRSLPAVLVRDGPFELGKDRESGFRLNLCDSGPRIQAASLTKPESFTLGGPTTGSGSSKSRPPDRRGCAMVILVSATGIAPPPFC